MPYFVAVCGVSPNWAKTGTPALTSARTTSGKSAAASTLIMSAPPSVIRRDAAASALSIPCCTGPNGMSQLTGAIGDARDLIIPGDDADALLAVALHLLKRGNGHVVRHYSVRPVRSRVTYIKDVRWRHRYSRSVILRCERSEPR